MNIQSLKLVVDLNQNGSYSLLELWGAAKFVYYLPGNLIVEALGHIPYLAPLLNIHASQATGYGSLNGLLSVTLTLIFWILVVFGTLTLCSPTVDEIDDTSENNASPTQNQQYTPEQNQTPSVASHAAVPASPRTHMHLPVSRKLYAAPGTTPKRHPWHRSGMKPIIH